MMINADEIQSIAQETGFLPSTLEKVIRLSELLDEIKNHPYLGTRLVL